MKVSPTKILWHEPWVMLANAWVMLPIGLMLSSCLVGVPIAMRALKGLARHALRNARVLNDQAPPADPEKSYAGSISFVILWVVGAVMLAAGAMAAHVVEGAPGYVRFVVQVIGGGLGAVVISAALAPLAFAPIVAIDGVGGFFGPFARSFEVAARRGPRASALLGARAGLAFAIPHLAICALAYVLSMSPDGMDSLTIAGPIAAWVGIPRALVTIAAEYVEQPDVASGHQSSTKRLRGLAWMIAPSLLVLFGTLVIASFSPTSMRRGSVSDAVPRGLGAIGLSATPREGRLPGTSVSIRTTDHGIVVEAADGGGAGAIDAGFDTTQCLLRVGQRTDNDAPVAEYRVAVRSDTHVAYVLIDADGVRLDDSISDRTLGRLGSVGSAALAIGMLLLLFISFTVGGELGAAQTMSAPALLSGAEREDGGLAGLEGKLRIGEDSRVFYSRPSRWSWLLGRGAGTLRVEGEAWVEADGGAIRFRLPDAPAEVLGSASSDDWDGKHVVLLSTFASTGVAGLRTAAAPWPLDGRLTLGSHADARELLVTRAIKRAGRVAMPVMASFGVACVALLLEL